jgi:hypothetical protein
MTAINPNLRACLLAAFVSATLIGCTDDVLEVDTPDIIDPDALNNPQGAGALYAGAVSEVVFQMDNNFGLALVSALFTDEAMHASTPPAVREWDLRNVLPSNATAPALFLNLQRARARTEQAAELLTGLTTGSDPRMGELWALAGFTYILFAEHYCSGVPISKADPLEYGAPQTTTQLLDAALARLTSASTAAAGDARIINLVAVLRGRALLNKGDFAQAAQAVANVPTSYAYQIFHSTTTPRQTNQIPVQFSTDILSVPNVEGTNGLNFASASDPRVATRATGNSRNDGITPMVQFTKYASQADPVTHASGIEARLIEAEAALRANNPSLFVSKLNDARATVTGLTPLTDPGTETARVNLLFRERGFWLYLTAHRLGDLRRMVRQYARPAESVFPTGAYHKQGLTRGLQVTFVVPQPEENNPNYVPTACDPTKP